MLYVKNAAIIRGREYTGDYSTVTLINIQPLTAQKYLSLHTAAKHCLKICDKRKILYRKKHLIEILKILTKWLGD
jgi:hypothetical protein